MLKITSQPEAKAVEIPRNLTNLSVSWLNDQFRAVAVHRGEMEGTWQHPGPIEGANQFKELIKQAVSQTGYRGSSVSIVLAHQRLAHQLIEVPPVKNVALARLVNRQAQQQKLFQGEAAWSYHPVLSAKGTQRLVLNLFPKVLLNELVTACEDSQLFLTTVLPPSAVLQHQLTQLPPGTPEITLLAAETGGATSVLVGQTDGQVLLARTLAGNWNDSLAKMVVDLNRTMLFVNQQFGVSVGSVFLFGKGAMDHLAEVQGKVPIPVRLSPVEFADSFWATESLRLAQTNTANFISLERQKAPQRKVMLKVITAATCALFVASLVLAYYLDRQRRLELANISKLQMHEAELQAQHQQLQRLHEELIRKQGIIKLVSDGRPPPVAGWFLGYLSEAIPSELVVTNFHLKREDNLWKFQLSGLQQIGAKPAEPGALGAAVTALTNRLASGPFHVRLGGLPEKDKDKAPAAKAAAPGDSLANWVANKLSNPPVTPVKTIPADGQFALEGVMQ